MRTRAPPAEAGKIGATTFPQARRIDVVLEEGEAPAGTVLATVHS